MEISQVNHVNESIIHTRETMLYIFVGSEEIYFIFRIKDDCLQQTSGRDLGNYMFRMIFSWQSLGSCGPEIKIPYRTKNLISLINNLVIYKKVYLFCNQMLLNSYSGCSSSSLLCLFSPCMCISTYREWSINLGFSSLKIWFIASKLCVCTLLYSTKQVFQPYLRTILCSSEFLCWTLTTIFYEPSGFG